MQAILLQLQLVIRWNPPNRPKLISTAQQRLNKWKTHRINVLEFLIEGFIPRIIIHCIVLQEWSSNLYIEKLQTSISLKLFETITSGQMKKSQIFVLFTIVSLSKFSDQYNKRRRWSFRADF